MRAVLAATIGALTMAQAAASEVEYWVPWNFAGEACRRSNETPEQFVARRAVGRTELDAAQVRIVEVRRDGAPYFEVHDRGDVFTFWTDITSCRTAVYGAGAKADPYR